MMRYLQIAKLFFFIIILEPLYVLIQCCNLTIVGKKAQKGFMLIYFENTIFKQYKFILKYT